MIVKRLSGSMWKKRARTILPSLCSGYTTRVPAELGRAQLCCTNRYHVGKHYNKYTGYEWDRGGGEATLRDPEHRDT